MAASFIRALLLFSPKGGIEGVLIAVKSNVRQVSTDPETGAVLAKITGPGKRLRLLAVADHSPKTKHSHHPVYKFVSFADASGNPIELPEADLDNVTIRGVVESMHYARHGQPNGVVLETGEFIHLRPDGMAQAALEIGSKVTAVGQVRMTLLGTSMLETHRINRIDLT